MRWDAIRPRRVVWIRVLLIDAIARGMDTTTQQHLFNVSGLGMEYSAIIQNLVMLGVTPMQVGVEEEGEE